MEARAMTNEPTTLWFGIDRIEKTSEPVVCECEDGGPVAFVLSTGGDGGSLALIPWHELREEAEVGDTWENEDVRNSWEIKVEAELVDKNEEKAVVNFRFRREKDFRTSAMWFNHELAGEDLPRKIMEEGEMLHVFKFQGEK